MALRVAADRVWSPSPSRGRAGAWRPQQPPGSPGTPPLSAGPGPGECAPGGPPAGLSSRAHLGALCQALMLPPPTQTPLVLRATSTCSDHTFGDLEMVSSLRSEESPRPEAPGAIPPMVGAGSLAGAPGGHGAASGRAGRPGGGRSALGAPTRPPLAWQPVGPAPLPWLRGWFGTCLPGGESWRGATRG